MPASHARYFDDDVDTGGESAADFIADHGRRIFDKLAGTQLPNFFYSSPKQTLAKLLPGTLRAVGDWLLLSADWRARTAAPHTPLSRAPAA